MQPSLQALSVASEAHTKLDFAMMDRALAVYGRGHILQAAFVAGFLRCHPSPDDDGGISFAKTAVCVQKGQQCNDER